MKISCLSYIHCMCEVVKIAWTSRRDWEMKEARNMLTYTSEAREGDAMGKKELRVLKFLNNDLFTHLMATIEGWDIFALPRINYGFPSSSWHEVHNRAKQSGPFAMAAVYYSINKAADAAYFIHWFECPFNKKCRWHFKRIAGLIPCALAQQIKILRPGIPECGPQMNKKHF